MLRAIHFADHDAFAAQALPGSTHFDLVNSLLWFFCPCGCGLSHLGLSDGPPSTRASPRLWEWNRKLSEPTLCSSVTCLGCGWHGWLRDGYWEAV